MQSAAISLHGHQEKPLTGPDRYRAQISTLFNPRRIVVLGASATRVSDGNNAVTNLIRHGHRDKLSIIHPNATAPTRGVPTYRRAADLPERPDVALVSIPAARVLDALRDLDSIGCPVAVVPSAGFKGSLKAELLRRPRSQSEPSATQLSAGIVTVGSGGALVELYGDVATAAAPLDTIAATRMIASTIAGRLMDGYRQLQPPSDLKALAALLVNVSWLAHDHHALLAALDLDPVLVEHNSGRISIVDSLIIAADVPPTAAVDD